jgi:hypothetical protein
MSYLTKQQLIDKVNSDFASGKPNKINASDLRGVTLDVIDSYLKSGFTLTGNAINAGQTTLDAERGGKYLILQSNTQLEVSLPFGEDSVEGDEIQFVCAGVGASIMGQSFSEFELVKFSYQSSVDSGYLQIADAGVQDVNGFYYQIGIYNSRPRYQKMGTKIRIYYESGQWIIDVIPSSVFYFSTTNSNTPIGLTWSLAGDGNEPFPVISSYSGWFLIRNYVEVSDIKDASTSGKLLLKTQQNPSIGTILQYVSSVGEDEYHNVKKITDEAGVEVLDWNGSNRELVSAGNRLLIDFQNSLFLRPGVGMFDIKQLPAIYDQELSNPTSAIATIGSQTYSPVSGVLTIISDSANILTVFIDNQNTINSLTIELGTYFTGVIDGASVTIFARSQITSLTINTTGHSFYGTAVSDLEAGKSIEFRKHSPDRLFSGPGTVLRVR